MKLSGLVLGLSVGLGACGGSTPAATSHPKVEQAAEAKPDAKVDAPAPVIAAAEVSPDCLSASYNGPVGNCIEPSLVIVDRCASRKFELLMNDCARPMLPAGSRIDGNATPVVGVRAHDKVGTKAATELKVDKITGTLQRAGDLVTEKTRFDLEIQLAGPAGEIQTVQLKGESS